MDDPRRPPGSRNPGPRPDGTTADAFAPPPGTRQTVLTFVAALVFVVCGVAGVLSFFTEFAIGYRVLLLAVALGAGAGLVALRRSR